MTEILFFDTLRQALWIAVVISAPILTAALALGVAIGLFQALTSVQEITLTFVPKLAGILVAFWITMNFMTERLVSFFSERLIPLIGGI